MKALKIVNIAMIIHRISHNILPTEVITNNTAPIKNKIEKIMFNLPLPINNCSNQPIKNNTTATSIKPNAIFLPPFGILMRVFDFLKVITERETKRLKVKISYIIYKIN
jgi:hypothetical protein